MWIKPKTLLVTQNTTEEPDNLIEDSYKYERQ